MSAYFNICFPEWKPGKIVEVPSPSLNVILKVWQFFEQASFQVQNSIDDDL